MKSALLALSVILACIAYELDRGPRVADDWHTQVEVDRLLNEEVHAGSSWMPAEDDSGTAYVRPAPHVAEGHTARTGSVEREHSIRLFGPGVSRRQQIRV